MKAQRGFLAIAAVLKALGGMLDVVPAIAWAAVVALLLATSCTQGNMLQNEKTKHATTKKDFAEYTGAVERRESERTIVALAETEKQVEITRFRNKQATEADNATRNEFKVTAAALIARSNSRVFDAALERFAATSAAGGQGSGDPTAVRRAEEKTAALGSLLKTCRAEGASDAGELEDLASQVRGLQARYLISLSSGSAATPPTSVGSPAD